MSRILSRCLLLILVAIVCASGVSAQENSTSFARDPHSLAQRYLGFTGTLPSPPLVPIYKVGDKSQFWVGKLGSDTPTRVTATLAAATDSLYLWVEDGVNPGADLTKVVQNLSQTLFTLRQRGNYRQSVNVPGLGSINDPNDLLPIPDVDGDAHLYVLYTTDLIDNLNAFTNPIDSLPAQYAPYSNQHEMLYVSTSPYPGTALSDPVYLSMIVRGMYHWIMNYNIPQQAGWLTDALNWALLFSLQQTKVGVENLSAYLQSPDTPLLQPLNFMTGAQTLGGQQLFLSYLIQRYGAAPLTDLFLQPGSGIAPLDSVLAKNKIIDPVSGAPVTGRDAFADFVMANGLDFAFGDGRYMEAVTALPQNQLAVSTPLVSGKDIPNLTVNQFGVQYFRYTAAQAGDVKLSFDGSATVPRLPMPDDSDPANHFYWSGHTVDQDSTLTRAVDLSGVSTATLTFDTWYGLDPNWNYAYVSASTDNGATWTALTASNSTISDLYGAAYSVGFTGVSNAQKPHPAPSLGIFLSADGRTITSVVADSTAAKAGLLKGDVIIGYDHQTWTAEQNLSTILGYYKPGDTIKLYVQRVNQQLDVPVVVESLPTELINPAPLWLHQTVDLSSFAGKQILLRFELVTLPGHQDEGFAVDNLAIPEIHWSDNAEGSPSGWTLNGWQQIDNQEPQQWIVQTGTSGTQTTFPRVHLLINDTDTTTKGEWRVPLAQGEVLTLAVAAVNDDTTVPATFSLSFSNQ